MLLGVHDIAAMCCDEFSNRSYDATLVWARK
jgi:hypothetical protein